MLIGLRSKSTREGAGGADIRTSLGRSEFLGWPGVSSENRPRKKGTADIGKWGE